MGTRQACLQSRPVPTLNVWCIDNVGNIEVDIQYVSQYYIDKKAQSSTTSANISKPPPRLDNPPRLYHPARKCFLPKVSVICKFHDPKNLCQGFGFCVDKRSSSGVIHKEKKKCPERRQSGFDYISMFYHNFTI